MTASNGDKAGVEQLAESVWHDAYTAVYGCAPTHPPEAYRGAP
jgi:hypothetical protein